MSDHSTDRDAGKRAGFNKLLMAVLLIILHRVPASAETVGRSLSGYLRFAQTNNAEIAAARADAESAEHDASLAATLPDPQFSAGYFISEVETRVGPQRAKIGASQMIPWPAKLAEKGRAAQKNFLASKARLASVEAMIFAKIRHAYAELYALGREIDINRENLKLMKYMESVALSRYETGSAMQVSVLKIQVETAMLEDMIISLESDAVKRREDLRALLNCGESVEIPFPENLPELSLPEETDSIAGAVLAENPGLKAASFRTEEAASGVELARLAFAPDLMVMTDYIFTAKSNSPMISADENGKDPWVVGASVTIPLWAGKKVKSVRRAEAVMESKLSEKAGIENSLKAKAAGFLEDLLDVQRKIVLYEKALIPKARQTLSLIEESYRNSRADVLDFLDAERTLLNLETALARQYARREAVAADIDMLMGGALTRNALDRDNRID